MVRNGIFVVVVKKIGGIRIRFSVILSAVIDVDDFELQVELERVLMIEILSSDVSIDSELFDEECCDWAGDWSFFCLVGGVIFFARERLVCVGGGDVLRFLALVFPPMV